MRNASAATQFRTLVVSDSPYAVVSAFLKEQADVHLTVERVYHDDVATFTDVLARFSDSAPSATLTLNLTLTLTLTLTLVLTCALLGQCASAKPTPTLTRKL